MKAFDEIKFRQIKGEIERFLNYVESEKRAIEQLENNKLDSFTFSLSYNVISNGFRTINTGYIQGINLPLTKELKNEMIRQLNEELSQSEQRLKECYIVYKQATIEQNVIENNKDYLEKLIKG